MVSLKNRRKASNKKKRKLSKIKKQNKSVEFFRRKRKF